MQNRGYDVINGVNHTHFEGWNIVKVEQILRFMAGFDLMEVILQTKYNFLLYNAILLLFDENFAENDVISEFIENLRFSAWYWWYSDYYREIMNTSPIIVL